MSLKVLKYLAAVVATAACAACGGGGGYGSTPASPSTTTTSTTNALTITVTSRNGAQSFSPNPATAGGQMVVFKNADSIAHRVVLNDGTIDTGLIAPGATSVAVQMPAAGANYHCSIHPDMVGSVNSASGGAAPPDNGGGGTGTGY